MIAHSLLDPSPELPEEDFGAGGLHPAFREDSGAGGPASQETEDEFLQSEPDVENEENGQENEEETYRGRSSLDFDDSDPCNMVNKPHNMEILSELNAQLDSMTKKWGGSTAAKVRNTRSNKKPVKEVVNCQMTRLQKDEFAKKKMPEGELEMAYLKPGFGGGYKVVPKKETLPKAAVAAATLGQRKGSFDGSEKGSDSISLKATFMKLEQQKGIYGGGIAKKTPQEVMQEALSRKKDEILSLEQELKAEVKIDQVGQNKFEARRDGTK